MPWKETCVMDERLLLVAQYRDGRIPMTELCRAAGVSRKTAYKWIARHAAEGAGGLGDRSKAPHVQARQTAAAVVEQLVALKRQRPRWGPKKLVAILRERHPEMSWPATSTVSGILDARCLVKRRKRRRQAPPYPHPLQPCAAPNEVWTIDFKGQFKTGDGVYCYPLTIADGYSRFVLGCTGFFKIDQRQVQPQFQRVSRNTGCRRRFVATTVHRSRIAAWGSPG
jgi:putative transposase